MVYVLLGGKAQEEAAAGRMFILPAGLSCFETVENADEWRRLNGLGKTGWRVWECDATWDNCKEHEDRRCRQLCDQFKITRDVTPANVPAPTDDFEIPLDVKE